MADNSSQERRILIDRFGRVINYLRISVTDRCNLRCIYCMPKEGIKYKRRNEILSYEEIYDFVKVGLGLGIKKIRLTGGEPLIRRDIRRLIEMLSSLSEVEDLSLTTNGTLLSEYAWKLKLAGLKRVNISLDSLNPNKYRRITRGGEIIHTLKGIEAAIQAGLNPVKINCVILRGMNDNEIEDFIRFGQRHQIMVQFIQRMRITQQKPQIDNAILIKRPPDCRICNRLRLTVDGFLKPCLLSDDEINIRHHNHKEAIMEAVAHKPEFGNRCRKRKMVEIGG